MESKKPIIISDGANNIEVYDDKIVFDIGDKKETCKNPKDINDVFAYIFNVQRANRLRQKLEIQEVKQ